MCRNHFITYGFLLVKVEDNYVFYFNFIFSGTIRGKILKNLIKTFNIQWDKKRSEFATIYRPERNK
jgi:hypothetical protein